MYVCKEKGKTEEQLFLRWLRMLMQDVIRLSARTVRWQLHREGYYYSRATMHKPRITVPPSTGQEGSLNGLMSMKMMWIICYGLHSHRISTHMNTCGRFWTNALDSALHHHHQNIKWGNIFWKNGVHPSSRVQRLGESMPRSTEAVLEARGGPTPYWDTLCWFFL